MCFCCRSCHIARTFVLPANQDVCRTFSNAFQMRLRCDCQCCWPQWNLIRILGDIWFTLRAHCTLITFFCMCFCFRLCIEVEFIWFSKVAFDLICRVIITSQTVWKKMTNGILFISNLCKFITIEAIKEMNEFVFRLQTFWNGAIVDGFFLTLYRAQSLSR